MTKPKVWHYFFSAMMLLMGDIKGNWPVKLVAAATEKTAD